MYMGLNLNLFVSNTVVYQRAESIVQTCVYFALFM